jgi:hypothetical protein
MSQQSLQDKVNAELDQSVAQLDDLTLAKIKAARLNALGNANKPSFWRSISRVLSPKQGALALCFSLLMVLVFVAPFSEQTELTLEPELALMAAMNPVLAEEPEMLSELEFLAWLEQEQLL